MRRLYLKIYLGFLVVVTVAVLGGGVLVHTVYHRHPPPTDRDHPIHRTGGLVGLLAFFAVALGAGSYPIARRITRRLEAVRDQVALWRDGDLSARAPVEGDDEVAQLAARFNDAAARIEELVDQQRRMLRSASHELRSPLARLRVALELLEARPKTPPRDLIRPCTPPRGAGSLDVNGHYASVAGIHDSTHSDGDLWRPGFPAAPLDNRAGTDCERLLADARNDIIELDELVGELLAAARAGDRHSVARGPVDLGAIVAAAADDASVPVDLGGGALEVLGDSALLRRAVRNLLDNARRHGGGDVLIRVRSANGAFQIAVEDAGDALPAVAAARLFEPFYRPQGHDEGSDGGVGLGLALVREIAEAHGGRAGYAATERGSSSFWIELPRHGPPESEAAPG